MGPHTRIKALDERIKLLAAISMGIAALISVHWQSQALALGISLIVLVMCRAVFGVLIFLAALGLLTAGIFYFRVLTDGSSFIGMGLVFMILKFGPFFAMMVFLYRIINTSLLLRTLEQMKMPAQILIPLGVTLRFMPSFAKEFRHIRDAMAFRGISFSIASVLTRPFSVMEFILIPLLMRSLFIGEELSRAAITRGITSKRAPASFYVIRLRWSDIVFSVIWLLGIALILGLDHWLGGR